MILAGTEIKRRVEDGTIIIDPFESEHLNSASIDLTLGDRVAVYEDFTYCGVADEWEAAKTYAMPVTYPPDFLRRTSPVFVGKLGSSAGHQGASQAPRVDY